MATIKAVLYRSKTLSNGEHPIMLRITKGNIRKYLSLGISCAEEDWDAKEQLPKRRHPNFYELQTLIQMKKQEFTSEVYKTKIQDKPLDIEKVRRKVSRGGRGKVKLLEYFTEVIDKFRAEGRIGYSAIFKSVRGSLSKFFNGDDVHFKEITTKTLEDYEAWLVGRSASLVTRSAYFRTFRTLFRMAIAEEIVAEDIYPFKGFAFAKYNDPETQPRSIPKSDIEKLFALTPKVNSKAFHSLNYFKFSFYSYGMNFIDMAKLKKNQIKGNTIEYERSKTRKRIVVAMLPQAKEVLKYYLDNYVHSEGYVFPILPPGLSDAVKLHDKIIEKRVDYNEGLETLRAKAGIEAKLTSYVARHSFAHICYTNGVEKKVIGESLGHTLEKTTNKYIGKLDKAYVSESIYSALK